MKFKLASEKYFAFAKKTIKLRTYLHYLLLYKKHIACVFDEKKITSIKNEDIENFIKSKSVLSNSSVKLVLCVVKNIINYARDFLHLKINLIIKHKIKTSKKEVEPLTKKEQFKLENYILSNKLFYKYGIIISLYTGLRIGELLAINWQDVDIKRKVITINKTVCTLTENKKSITWIDLPKTENGQRIVPIPTNVVPLLNELKVYQQNNSKYLISTKRGKQIKVRVYQKSFENLLKKLNIKHYGFHSLRHTFATRAIECGCDVKCLSKILGHADIAITLKTYVFASLELKNKLVEKVGRSLKMYKKKNT